MKSTPIPNTANEIHQTISYHSICLKKETLIIIANAPKIASIFPITCLDKGNSSPF